MFGGYLRIRSKGFQLAVFMIMWVGFYLIAASLQTVLLGSLFHVKAGDGTDFLTKALAEHSLFVIIFNTIYSILAFGLPAFLFAYLAHPKPATYLGLIRPEEKRQWLWVILLAVGMIPVLSVIGGLINTLNLGEEAHRLQEIRETQIGTYLRGATGLDVIRNIILLALIPAFCEELFFRGVVQKFAFSFRKNAKAAIFISALAFALIHMSIYDLIPIFIAGLFLAWVYQETGSLWLNITIHFLFNGLQVVIAYVSVNNDAFDQLGNDWAFLISAFFIGALILTFALLNLFKLRTPFTQDWDVEDIEELKAEEN